MLPSQLLRASTQAHQIHTPNARHETGPFSSFSPPFPTVFDEIRNPVACQPRSFGAGRQPPFLPTPPASAPCGTAKAPLCHNRIQTFRHFRSLSKNYRNSPINVRLTPSAPEEIEQSNIK